MFETFVFLASLFGGGIAALAGFGIGSVITPMLATRFEMKLAVAMVSIPHVVGTAVRLWYLRHELDRRVMMTFGVASAAGGLTGAVLHSWLAGRALTYILAALLIFAGITGVLGIQLRFGRTTGLIAGALSGLLGGLVGNQGGIRSGAMLGFDVPKNAFIATSSAVAMLVDGARVPVYLYTEGERLMRVWPIVAIATVGVVAGTFIGRSLLGKMPEATFKRVVSGIVLLLGISLLF